MDVKPEPVPAAVICSVCGEPWPAHHDTDGDVPVTECIRLLRAKANRNQWQWRPNTVYPQYPVVTFSSSGTDVGATLKKMELLGQAAGYT